MAMVVKVQWESGKPVSGAKVCAWVNGEGNDDIYTDENGEAHFLYGPGKGTIYVGGEKIRSERYLSSRVTIYRKQTGLFSTSYY